MSPFRKSSEVKPMKNLLRTSVWTLATLAMGFTLALGPPTVRQANAQEPGPAQEQARVITVKILGMSCPFCAYGVEQKLKKLDGVKELSVELKSGLATLTMKPGADVSNESLRTAVDDAGFEAAAVVRSFESEYEDWHPEEMPDSVAGPGSEAVSRSTPSPRDVDP